MTTETDGTIAGTEGETIVQPSTVETPEGATSEATTEQQTGAETPGQADETGDQPKRKPWWEKRFDELTAKRYAAENEAAYWRGLAEAGGGNRTTPEPTPAGPPTLEQCGWDDAEFQRQTADYFRKEAEQAAVRALDSRTAKERQQAQIQTAAAKMQEGAAKHPDFMDVVHDIPLNDAVADLLAHAPNAADVLYHAAKDPAEARRIFSLSPYLQAVELGKIAARLETPAPPSPKPIPPAPPATVGGISAGLNKSLGEMSMAEYIAARKKQQEAT